METDAGWTDALEKEISKLESVCAPVVKRLADGALPDNDRDREAIASFVALQFVRGKDARTVAEKFMTHAGKMMLLNTTREVAADALRKTEQREPTKEEIDEYLEFVRDPSLDITPHPNHVIMSTLHGLQELVGIAFARTIFVVRWDSPMLLTSDVPVVLYSSKRDTMMNGLGFVTAEEIIMPLSRHAALVLEHPGKNDRVVRNPSGADVSHQINWLVAENATDTIWVHPEQEKILDQLHLPPPVERGIISPPTPFRFVPDGA